MGSFCIYVLVGLSLSCIVASFENLRLPEKTVSMIPPLRSISFKQVRLRENIQAFSWDKEMKAVLSNIMSPPTHVDGYACWWGLTAVVGHKFLVFLIVKNHNCI